MMNSLLLSCFVADRWVTAKDYEHQISSALSQDTIACYGSYDIDYHQMLHFSRNVGCAELGRLTFHQRAKILKALALYLSDHKKELYALGYQTGATRSDNWIDIDGGIATLFVYSSKGRREMPDSTVYLDGEMEMLSRDGTFVGQHICQPKQGLAVQINAFNFPVWGMLEKFAQSFLAGVPSLVKPATVTSYLTHACVQLMVQSGLLPAGSLQLIIGRIPSLMPLLGAQDSVSFTGSASTANLLRQSVPKQTLFNAEQDSLNGAILGTDADKSSPEFDLFIQEAVKEITTKAGQKCTAMRRLIVPKRILKTVTEALYESLSAIKLGDPSTKETQMGALVSQAQRDDVLQQCGLISRDARCVLDGQNHPLAQGDGAFLAPTLLVCDDPHQDSAVHHCEAFGPVATLMGYGNPEEAYSLANKGGGSLVVSIISHDSNFVRKVALGVAPWHGRIYINNRDSASEATGHGSPMPHMTHGGPGRAGGGEELGGIRGVLHHMQRTAIQGSPSMIATITKEWMVGAKTIPADPHPFKQYFEDLAIGTRHCTPSRVVTLKDIAYFAEFTGDHFYAHTDNDAAAANPFFPSIVAHGYLLLSFAAGLFVDPAPGPVLANTGLSNLSFQKPVVANDVIHVELTVKRKTPRNDHYGEVRWFVKILNQHDEPIATYQLLTMNALRDAQ